MKAIKRVIEYNLAEETKHFEEHYDVEFPEDATLLEQLKFVRETEDAEYNELTDESRHTLFSLISALIEMESIGELLNIPS